MFFSNQVVLNSSMDFTHFLLSGFSLLREFSPDLTVFSFEKSCLRWYSWNLDLSEPNSKRRGRLIDTFDIQWIGEERRQRRRHFIIIVIDGTPLEIPRLSYIYFTDLLYSYILLDGSYIIISSTRVLGKDRRNRLNYIIQSVTGVGASDC